VDWIHLAQDKDWWRILVNTKQLGSTQGWKFLHYLSVLSASQGLCYIELVTKHKVYICVYQTNQSAIRKRKPFCAETRRNNKRF
jgi:hypothetical protein